MLSSRGARLSPRILPSFRQSYSSGPNANPRPRPPPRSLLHFDTIYPFILLSAITSLALNLSHSRSTFTNLADHLRAQISVLEAVLANERLRVGLTPEEQDDIERQLELVGLGRAKGRESKEAIKGRFGTTAWREVFFGKKGDEWEVDVDADGKEADWEKLFAEASEADERQRQVQRDRAQAAPALPVEAVHRAKVVTVGTEVPKHSQSKSDVYL